MQDCNFRLLA